MFNYMARRLLLLPFTLFCIVFVNFAIINLSPGEPTSVTEISPQGNAERKETNAQAFGSDSRYLQFREYFGLTLPILWNNWPNLSEERVLESVTLVAEGKESLPFATYNDLRITLGDQARFVMPKLVKVMENKDLGESIQSTAARFFIRGGTRQAFLGPQLLDQEKQMNRKMAADNQFLLQQMPTPGEDAADLNGKIDRLIRWYKENITTYNFLPTEQEKVVIFFSETRFFKYFKRVLTLNFGTLRDDSNKTVLREVVSRFKYSLRRAARL